MIFRLAARLAYFSLHGSLTWGILRDGRAVRIRSFRGTVCHLSPTRGSVLVSISTELVFCPEAFPALGHAICGADGTVITENVQINPITNVPLIHTTTDIYLAWCCLVALRMVFYTYNVSDQGSVAALPFTAGFHSVLTIVGHTDEGGYLRVVLRESSFAKPFGLINFDETRSYTHFSTR